MTGLWGRYVAGKQVYLLLFQCRGEGDTVFKLHSFNRRQLIYIIVSRFAYASIYFKRDKISYSKLT